MDGKLIAPRIVGNDDLPSEIFLQENIEASTNLNEADIEEVFEYAPYLPRFIKEFSKHLSKIRNGAF